MRSLRMAAGLSALTGTLLLGAAPAVTAADVPSCRITWGSVKKSSADLVSNPIVGARAGRHACFDRLVVDLKGTPAAGYFVEYVDVVRADGSGDPLPVAGGARLRIHILAAGYDHNYRPTAPWSYGSHIVSAGQFRGGGFQTFRDLVWGGSFEGESTFALGVRARLPFRVFKLNGPGAGSRLVIDVAHRW
jgi:hypothetical protein